MKQSRLMPIIVASYCLSLHFLYTDSVVVVISDTTPSRHKVNNTNHDENTCTTMKDGSCMVDKSSDFVAVVPAQKLPDIDRDGYIDLEYSEKKQRIVSHDPVATEKTKIRLIEMNQYMYNEFYVNGPHDIRKDCLNRHELCTYWASIGECVANPSYMTIECAPACTSCDQLIFETRCPIEADIDISNTWKVDDLNLMFQNIVNNPYYEEQYGKIDIILQPGMKPPHKYTELSDSPWIITIDDFLTPEECDAFIKLGSERGYLASKDLGPRKFDGTYHEITSPGLTSKNTWCLDECYNNTITVNVLQKVVNLTGVPEANLEYLQLLRYEVGQFYQTHHDYVEYHEKRRQGVRILTVYFYLNDVESGGGTNFPLLNVTVMPKRGRVLVWPSVLNENPSAKDVRTDHQALPVLRGQKYGANTWLHLRDYQTPYKSRCV